MPSCVVSHYTFAIGEHFGRARIGKEYKKEEPLPTTSLGPYNGSNCICKYPPDPIQLNLFAASTLLF